ncbi:GNAT family N-acetyltransferase [Nonlabens agnitus]|uniref:GNAT family N-acetyltransferase n=1 Tax=Nonlabens agnitus TaxID=870484 RepID=A0A2S9WTI4_9FLAO|nr:GNAT family N-acetyltransferase [Nonlabens agnitus]PRP66791.1 GNAT family N-acetyltransferase [Nonlabens agnitus]
MSFDLQRTNADDVHFKSLIPLLDQYLSITDGDDHDFYNQFNQLEQINHVVVAYKDQKAVGCGAIKKVDAQTVEIKRMFTLETVRGKGVATQILKELEKWAEELGFDICRLETGIHQPEAIALYKKNGYSVIPNYDQYVGMELSICFEKSLLKK